MFRLGLALHQLRPHDISHTIRHKDGRCHEALFGLSGYISRAEHDRQTYHGSKEADERVANHRRDGTVAPFRLPNQDKPDYHGEAAQEEQEDANVSNSGAKPAGQRDSDGANEAKGELEEDALERGVAERGHNEGTKA